LKTPPIKSPLPKIQISTPEPSGIPGVPKINLPTFSTIIKPVSLKSPAAVTPQPKSGLAVAYTPQHKVLENIKNIDPKRLNSRRARGKDNSYSVPELKELAGKLNLPKSGNKADLVNRIREAILKINPNAFD